MSDIDKMLEQAESLQSEGEWEIISRYRRNDTYVDDDGAVNIVGRRIDAIRENISVQGENHSQYIEFVMDRYYDGIDIAEQTLAIHYEVGDVSDEDAPINVYKNDTQIKFGWVVENTLTQYEATIEFCIWARGTLPDGNAYVLKTLPQRYEIKRGLEIAGGIIEPTNNWYMQFALTMDQKVAQASENADRAEQAASSLDGVVETVTTARDEVVQKASTVNTQHSEVENWHQEAEQFRNEAEQFRNQAEAITGIGLAEEGKPGIVQPDGVTTKVDDNGKLIVIGGGSGGGGTTDYQALENKPSIAGIELNGDKSYDELGIASKEAVARNFEAVNRELESLDTFTQQLDQDTSTLDNELEQTNQQLQSTTDKVEDVQESIEAGFKKRAQGEEVHIADSVDGKVLEFALFGKSEQKQYSGKNLLENTYATRTINGITFTVNDDGSITANGTATGEIQETVGTIVLKSGTYKLSGCPKGTTDYRLDVRYGEIIVVDTGDGGTISITEDTTAKCYIRIWTGRILNNVVFHPMIRLASIEDDTYEPYTGGIPSPNPDYPQEIETAGASGSVEVKSCGKNLLNNNSTSKTVVNVTFTVNEDKSVTVNGTANGNEAIDIGRDITILKSGKYTMSGNIANSNVEVILFAYIDGVATMLGRDYGSGFELELTKETSVFYRVSVANGKTASNVTVYPMISIEGGEYEPYKETKSIIPTPNGLSGIKVDSGGNYTDENGQQWITDEIVRYADGSGEHIQRVKHYSLAIADMNNDEDYPGWKGVQELSEVVGVNKNQGIAYGVMLNIGRRIFVNTYGGDVMFLAKPDFGMTQTEWKTNYPDLVVDIYLARVTPIRTPLTAEQLSEIDKLQTFKPITNISNNEQCGMKVTYATLQEALMLQEAYNQSRESAQEIVDIKKELSDTTFKVETIIEKADLGIKETASGEEIHLTDSAEGKAVEYSLYGKARQSTTTGKNIAPCTINFPYTQGGLTLTKNEDGSIHVSGTCTDRVAIKYDWNSVDDAPSIYKDGGQYIGSCYTSKGNITKSQLYFELSYFDAANAMLGYASVIEGQNTFTPSTTDRARDYLIFNNAKESSVTYDMDIYPMIRKASITDDTWEPYTNGASPNPDYPQEIEVSGESYNLLKNTATPKEIEGVTYTVNDDKSITANGTSSGFASININPCTLEAGTYILSGCPSNGGSGKYVVYIPLSFLGKEYIDQGSGVEFKVTETKTFAVSIVVYSGYKAENLKFYPMIRKASVKNDRYMPFGVNSVEVKSCGNNLLKHSLASQTGSGLTITVDESIKVNGTLTGGLTRFLFENRNNPIVSGEKGLFIKGAKILTNIEYNAKLIMEDASAKFVGIGTKGLYVNPNCKIEQIYIQCKESAIGLSVSAEIEPQIVGGNVDLPYQPYKETLSTIPTTNGLVGIKVSSGGNYTDQNGQQWICDEIVKYADGSGAYVQRVKKKLLSEATEITQETVNNITRFNVKNTLNGMTTKATWLMCNIFTNDISPASGGSVDNSICGFNGGATAYVICKSYTDIASFTQMLIDTNAYVIYALAEPIETPLTAEELAEIEKLSTFYPVTNISNDFDCGMSVKYLVDAKNYIDNKLAQIASAMVNNI